LHTCQKSQPAAILETHATIIDTEPDADAIDGSTMINTLTPRNANAAMEVLLTLQLYPAMYQITDTVFDVYQASSLKPETRSSQRWGQDED